MVSVVVFKIISVADRPPSSCFVAGFQVMTIAARLAASYFVTSCTLTVPLFTQH